MIGVDFPVSKWLGVMMAGSRGSLRDTVDNGLLLMIAVASYITVRKEEEVNLTGRDRTTFSMFRIDLICLSQTPPKLLAWGGLKTNSALWSKRYFFTESMFISLKALESSLRAPMKLLP